MKVTLAYPYTDAEGKSYDADKAVDLPEEEATQLVRDGRARVEDGSSSTKSSKKQEG